jgi:uncharacterized protein (DUF983 family)
MTSYLALLKNILNEKCPKCEQGKVFATSGNLLLLRIPKMHEHCSTCNHKFEKEPGYFFGAMFVSYALAVGEMLLLFLFLHVFISSYVTIILSIVAATLLLSTFNFRCSRMIWIYIFDGMNRKL